jgi:hypothetical protein
MEKKKERGSKMDFEKAKLNPAAVFKSPQEVVSIQELSREQKIEILRRWEQDARLMEVAEEENMPGPQPKPAPADSRRSARPQLLAGYRALEPQQSLRTGPQ